MFFFGPDDGVSNGGTGADLARFARAIAGVQERYGSMTLGMLTSFLCVAEGGLARGWPISVSDVVQRTGQKYPSVARQLDLLGNGFGGKPGLGLVRKHAGTTDRRARLVALTDRGRAWLSELDRLVSSDLVDLARKSSPSARSMLTDEEAAGSEGERDVERVQVGDDRISP